MEINFEKWKFITKMLKALNLFRSNIKYIENSFKYQINNGRIEGTNNLIKDILKGWLFIILCDLFFYQIYCLPTSFDKEPTKYKFIFSHYPITSANLSKQSWTLEQPIFVFVSS